jgi:flagellar motility protein MotE (MotC chaperone)
MRIKSPKFIIILLLLLIIGGIAGASALGLLNIKGMLSKVPLLKDTVLSSSTGKSTNQPSYEDLKKENDNLKKQVAELKKEATVNLSDQLNGSGATNSTSTNTAAVSAAAAAATAQQKKTYRNLADYYAGMKPETAVAILKNQDPVEVAGILHEMDKDTAGAILSAMDPLQAAKMIDLVGGIDSAAANAAGSQTSNQ